MSASAKIARRWFFLIVLLAVAAALAAPGPGYKIVNTFKVGGDGGWDYLTADAASRRLYISRATHMTVLDVDSGKIVGDIVDTPGVHGIALAPELGRGFNSNGRDGTVSIIDLKTLASTGKVKVGEGPDAIIYDAATKRVFTFNGRSQDSTAIDAASGKVVGTVRLDGRPEFAVSDGQGGVFVNIENKNELAAIDAAKLTVKSNWPLAPCESPSALAIDSQHRRLFVGCDNKMMAVVNADNGKVLTTLPIGDGVDAAAYDEGTGLAFASCGEGILTVVREESPEKFSVAENIPTQKGARTLALDSKTHNVFLATAKFGPTPPATPENPHPHNILHDSFAILVLGK
jgi:YVTN family beta-propeller protein